MATVDSLSHCTSSTWCVNRKCKAARSNHVTSGERETVLVLSQFSHTPNSIYCQHSEDPKAHKSGASCSWFLGQSNRSHIKTRHPDCLLQLHPTDHLVRSLADATPRLIMPCLLGSLRKATDISSQQAQEQVVPVTNWKLCWGRCITTYDDYVSYTSKQTNGQFAAISCQSGEGINYL